MKIVVNRCFGGFSISKKAAAFMADRGNKRAKLELDKVNLKTDGSKRRYSNRWFGYGYVDGMDGGYDRTDPDLVAAVETLGTEAYGDLAQLEVVEIPDDIDWEIIEYDGQESIHEVYRPARGPW